MRIPFTSFTIGRSTSLNPIFFLIFNNFHIIKGFTHYPVKLINININPAVILRGTEHDLRFISSSESV